MKAKTTKAGSKKTAAAKTAAPKATARVAAKTSQKLRTSNVQHRTSKGEKTDALGAVIPPKDTTLKSTFPRTTGTGHPVNERGKAIGASGSAPETQIGTPEKEAEGKVEPHAAEINAEIRESAAMQSDGRQAEANK